MVLFCTPYRVETFFPLRVSFPLCIFYYLLQWDEQHTLASVNKGALFGDPIFCYVCVNITILKCRPRAQFNFIYDRR